MTEEQNLTEEKFSEELYNKYNTSDRKTWAVNIAKDLAFADGNMWDSEDADSVEANNEPALSINETTPSIDLVVSIMTENNPRWQAAGTDRQDYKIASDVAQFHSHIWKGSNGNQVVENTLYDAEIQGMGIFMAYIDPYASYGEGEIRLIDVDPRTYYVDPLSKKQDGSDSPHKLIVKDLTEPQIKNEFPDFYEKHFRPEGNDIEMVSADSFESTNNAALEGQVENPATQENKYRAIDRYTKIKEQRYHIYEPEYDKILTDEQYQEYRQEPAFIETKSDGENYIINPSDVQAAEQLYQKTGGVYHVMINPQTGQPEIMAGVEHGGYSVQGSTAKLTPSNKGELIDQSIIRVEYPTVNRIKRVFTIGNRLNGDIQIMPIEDDPIVSYSFNWKRTPYPMSDVRLVRPLQQQLNKTRSKITAYLSSLTGMEIFVQKGSNIASQIRENQGKSGIKVYEVDMEVGSPPVIAAKPPLPAGVYEDSFNLINQIQRIIGAYAASDGNAQEMPRTKGGTILQDEFGQRRVNLKRKRMERALNQIAKVVSQMIPNVYRAEKVIRVVVPNGKSKFIEFNKREGDRIVNDLSIRYDVEFVSGSMMPTNQLQRYEIMNNAYQTGVLRDSTLVLQNMPFVDNLDEIIEREDKLKQYEQALQQAQEQIKQLNGQLQTKSREVIQAQEKVAVQKTQTKLDKLANRAEAAVEVGKQAITREVKKSNQERNEK